VCVPAAGGVRISLREPARGIAPGQAAVFYDGDAVLGSATIVRTR
jgi:tRNA-specific 2-thiouridylase